MFPLIHSPLLIKQKAGICELSEAAYTEKPLFLAHTPDWQSDHGSVAYGHPK